MATATSNDLIGGFEEEQRTVVFAALSNYLHLGLFTDVALRTKDQLLRAHKVVLAASSKFFRDFFRHNPQLGVVDLDRELGPHGLQLTFDDVRLIIGVLYCVGTVEISPQRIESLLVVAQVLGIPTLIRFLKSIKATLGHQQHQHQPVFFNPDKRESPERPVNPPPRPPTTSRPPSRSQSRATVASFGSFSLQPLPSPTAQSAVPSTAIQVQAGGNNVLESCFDPSGFLNNLPANQIDDLENVLLPHLHTSEEQQQTAESHASKKSDNSIAGIRIANESEVQALQLEEERSRRQEGEEGEERYTSRFRTLRPDSKDHRVEPVVLRPDAREVRSPSPLHGAPPPSPTPRIAISSTPPPSSPLPPNPQECSSDREELEDDVPSSPPPPPSQAHPQSSKSQTKEVKVYLESLAEGQSLKLALEGDGAKAVTLNFSADAVEEMRNSVVRPKGKNKSKYPCQFCSKAFPSKVTLDRHQAFHVSTNPSCRLCGKIFKRWALEQHMAVDHQRGRALNCAECGKVFRWERNLLAHVQLHHQEEKRRRCKFCPLTFMKKKYYINHQKAKHPDQPPTWCKLCLEIFDHLKQKDEHECPKVENTGRALICHRHDQPQRFRCRADLEEHLLRDHKESNTAKDMADKLRLQCPVCQKSFLLRKNLNVHIRRYHEGEDEKRRKFACSVCQKSFFYERDMKEHENTHKELSQRETYDCEDCKRKYSSRKALRVHRKLQHTQEGERNPHYKCDVCDKVLSNKYKLKYHMSVHSEKRCFKCSFCNTTFKARDNLRKHIIKYHK